MSSTIKGRVAATAAGFALAASAFGAAGCGDEESSTTAATSSASTEETAPTETSSSTSTTSTSATASAGFEEAAAGLESEGFELEEKSGEELVQKAGLSKPITAVAGAVGTTPGSSGDVLIYEFATPEDAEAVAKANDDDVLQSEVVGTIVIVSTASNTDLLDSAVAAIGG